MKMKPCEIPPNSAEPPLKKLKQNDHDENFFIGFDSGSSPTKALVKLKTVHLRKFKGFDPLKIKTGDLQSLSSKPSLVTNSRSSLEPICIPVDGKDTPHAVCNSRFLNTSESVSKKKVPLVRNAEIENVSLSGGSNHELDKSEINMDGKMTTEGIPVKYIQSPSKRDFCETISGAKTIINCVARKHTSKINLGFKKTLAKDRPISRMYVGNSSLNSCYKTSIRNGANNNFDLKYTVLKVSDAISESIVPNVSKERSKDKSSDCETISLCDSVKAFSSDEGDKVEPFVNLKNALAIPVNRGSLCAYKKIKSKLDKDEFTDSDSDTTSESLCSVSSSVLCESSEDDSEEEDRPFVDLTKFLACDFNLTNTNEMFESVQDVVICKTQNSQLKSDCQVKVYMLKASDITDTFCRNNRISGICGFKLKQSLCTLNHSPQNGYGNFITEVEEEEEEEEETLETPHFLMIRDPLIHSLFSILIKRDMREQFIPQQKFIDIINRMLGLFNPMVNRGYVNIRPKQSANINNVSANYAVCRPLLATSNGTYIPISNSSSISSVNYGYNRVPLINPNNSRPNFSHSFVNGGSGNLILFPNSVGTASGSTLLFQQPNNAIRISTPSRFIIGQSSQLAPPPPPPPLTLCSDLVRPGFQGQQLSLSQPPQLTKMNMPVAPVIDLTSNQNPQPHNYQQWPIGHFQNPHAIPTHYMAAPICCPNHKLDLYQLQSIMKTVVDGVKALIKIGLPKNNSSIMNAAFQMVYSNNLMCCKAHSISAVNRDENFRNVMNYITGCIMPYQFSELPLPSPRPCNLQPWMIPNYEMFIIKRFVFAIDKNTRTVIYPLPPNCIPRDNDLIDKLTVVIMISPLRGLGPGLIVFPHSLLNRNLLNSLESTSSITTCAKDWVLSAHQRGGLTQSMLLEFLDECKNWVNHSSQGSQPMLVVDWWWCIEQKMLNSVFKTLKVVNLNEKYDQHKDPLEISLGTTMERIWGILVRKFSQTIGPLTEASFPKFIIQVLKDLCTPPRLTAWCRASGLFPLDAIRAEEYRKSQSMTEMTENF